MSQLRAVCYLRISEDKTGEQFGIGTQRARTKKLVEARGWQLVDEYVDNSVSASQERGAGTAWAKMLKDSKANKFDVIVAVDLDRLLRQISDLSALIATGAKVVTVDGEVDLTTADGEFRATMLAGIARFEVRRKAERTKRANQQRREQGIPLKSLAVLGYTADGMTVIEDEAEAVRRTFTDFLAGVTMRQLADNLNAGGFVNGRGNKFIMRNVRYLLSNPRYAGLIKHHETGDLYPGNFPAIVSEDTWRAADEKLRDPSRRTAPGNVPKWLLSGLAWCGRCGGRNLRVGKTTTGLPAYRCDDHAHLSRKAAPIDEYVNAYMIARLSRPDAVELFQPAGEQVDVKALREERSAVQSRLDGLAGLFADGVLSGESVRRSSAELRKRLNEIDQKLTSGRESFAAAVVQADDVAAAWWALPLEYRRLLLDALVEVTVHPVGRGNHRGFRPESVEIVPRS